MDKFKIIRIIDMVISGILITMLTIHAIFFFSLGEGDSLPYFFEHFSVGIAIMLVGVIAYTLPILNKQTVRGTDKGDKLMTYAGVLAVILGIMTIIMTYMNI